MELRTEPMEQSDLTLARLEITVLEDDGQDPLVRQEAAISLERLLAGRPVDMLPDDLRDFILRRVGGLK